ncbi:MAG: ABC transporter ATP-binding protein [Oscillospiraceae bacterium]|jgi:ABC-2 type transport system ATP-binding protein|nr:ABC transporter ATP-binding protein [Oscillospiraceae bacterium]
MVKIRNLTKSYKNFAVLKGLNMTIEKGDVYGFIGRNGCGKTTTMNIICDVLGKDGGDVTLGDGTAKIKIGYLPESPSMFGYLSASEYLTYIAACCNRTDYEKRTSEVLTLVGLTDTGKRKIKGFSRGMNQRLGIAAAIYDEPDLLILDEPTSALDPMGRAEVMDIIRNLADNKTTIILCTHILSDVERTANRVGILVDGVMVKEGPIGEVLNVSETPTDVAVKFLTPTSEAFAVLKEIEGVNHSEINPQTGVLTLTGDDADTLCLNVIDTLAKERIIPESVQIVRHNLEEIYLQTIGGTKN